MKMMKNTFLTALIVGLLAGVVEAKQPNVMFIFADDQTFESIGAEVTAAYGGAFVDLAAVRSAIGPTSTFRSTADQGVVARDIGGTGYRVTAVAQGMFITIQ